MCHLFISRQTKYFNRQPFSSSGEMNKKKSFIYKWIYAYSYTNINICTGKCSLYRDAYMPVLQAHIAFTDFDCFCRANFDFVLWSISNTFLIVGTVTNAEAVGWRPHWKCNDCNAIGHFNGILKFNILNSLGDTKYARRSNYLQPPNATVKLYYEWLAGIYLNGSRINFILMHHSRNEM